MALSVYLFGSDSSFGSNVFALVFQQEAILGMVDDTESLATGLAVVKGVWITVTLVDCHVHDRERLSRRHRVEIWFYECPSYYAQFSVDLDDDRNQVIIR